MAVSNSATADPKNPLNFKDSRNWGSYGAMIGGMGAGAIGSGAGAMIGNYMGSMAGSQKENRRNEELTEIRLGDVTTLFKTKYYQDFMDTASAKSAIEQLRGNLLEAIKTGQSQAMGTGGTAEASIASKTGAQGNFANAVSQLAGYGTQHKENALGNLQRLIQMATESQSGSIRDQAMNHAMNANNIADVGGRIMSSGMELGIKGATGGIG